MPQSGGMGSAAIWTAQTRLRFETTRHVAAFQIRRALKANQYEQKTSSFLPYPGYG